MICPYCDYEQIKLYYVHKYYVYIIYKFSKEERQKRIHNITEVNSKL